jgi:hypothetical protein
VKVLAQDGGYFLETAKPLPEATPIENAVAVIEEMVRCREQIVRSPRPTAASRARTSRASS